MKPVTLKLGPSGKDAKFIEHIYSLWPTNPLNEREVVFQVGNGAALIELTPSFKIKGAVHLNWIQAHPQGAGIGSKALSALTDEADKMGVTLEGDLWMRGGRARDLVKFYGQHGFKIKGQSMVRPPQ